MLQRQILSFLRVSLTTFDAPQHFPETLNR